MLNFILLNSLSGWSQNFCWCWLCLSVWALNPCSKRRRIISYWWSLLMVSGGITTKMWTHQIWISLLKREWRQSTSVPQRSPWHLHHTLQLLLVRLYILLNIQLTYVQNRNCYIERPNSCKHWIGNFSNAYWMLWLLNQWLFKHLAYDLIDHKNEYHWIFCITKYSHW